MNLTFEEFKDWLARYISLREAQLSWEAKLPEDLMSLYDNTYVNNLGLQLDMTMEYLFGEYYRDICWFLYDCLESKNTRNIENNVSIENRFYSIKDLESYLEYAKKEMKFKVDTVS